MELFQIVDSIADSKHAGRSHLGGEFLAAHATLRALQMCRGFDRISKQEGELGASRTVSIFSILETYKGPARLFVFPIPMPLTHMSCMCFQIGSRFIELVIEIQVDMMGL